jgi:hypothetical protein
MAIVNTFVSRTSVSTIECMVYMYLCIWGVGKRGTEQQCPSFCRIGPRPILSLSLFSRSVIVECLSSVTLPTPPPPPPRSPPTTTKATKWLFAMLNIFFQPKERGGSSPRVNMQVKKNCPRKQMTHISSEATVETETESLCPHRSRDRPEPLRAGWPESAKFRLWGDCLLWPVF